MSLIQSLKVLHEYGFIHNDLKLDNMVIGDQYGGSLNQIKLIDFGLTKCYSDQYGIHNPNVPQIKFEGNLAFCSYNALKGNSLSRRDDLISLVYILLYLHSGNFQFLGLENEELDQKHTSEAKLTRTPEMLCENQSVFLEFTTEIFKYGYTQCPEY